MPRLLALLLLASAVCPVVPAVALAPETEQLDDFPPGDEASPAPVWGDMTQAWRPEPQAQVRIERRVIVRISPRLPLEPEAGDLPDPPRAPVVRRYEERHMDKCVAIKNIAGVHVTRESRLLLMMRDHSIVSANLEKSCNARDFYSGFYVEDSEDGKICAGRDTLHSRAGVNCELSKFRRLVPADE